MRLAGALLSRGRALALSLHGDTFRVLRATGESTLDPVTLRSVPVFSTVYESVAGKLQAGRSTPKDAPVSGIVLAETTLEWHTSVDTVVRVDDVIECTAVDAAGDPSLVGVRVRVAGPFLKSYATAHRYPVVEVT